MIEPNKISRLSPQDKLFMIYNKNCFSLPTLSTINFNEGEWKTEIKTKIHPNVIEKMIKDTSTIYGNETINNVGKCKGEGIVYENVCKLLTKLVDMSSETKENISDMIAVFGSILKLINDNEKFIPPWNGYKFGIVKYFFTVLLPWKLQAHEILVHVNTDCIPEDKHLQEFYLKTLRIIIQEMSIEKSSYEKMAILIYQICLYLNIKDEKSIILHVLIDSMCSMYNFKYEQLKFNTISLLKEDKDALSSISCLPLSDEKTSPMSKIILSNTKRTLEENYEKNKISTRINNGGLCIGDDVFDNGNISVSRLMIELDMLSEERLKDYIGENKITTFTIPENDIGYLQYREKLPICKVMTKDDGFYTLTRYEDNSYLLFKISGDSKCYGISFPSNFGGGRRVVVFDIPTNYEYIMSLK